MQPRLPDGIPGVCQMGGPTVKKGVIEFRRSSRYHWCKRRIIDKEGERVRERSATFWALTILGVIVAGSVRAQDDYLTHFTRLDGGFSTRLVIMFNLPS